jgi:large subunit ribosomal protein L17
MVRNTVVNLFQRERITTTLKKAKLVRPWAEKMITLGKRGTLHARRQALAFLRSKPAVTKLFGTLGPRYASRQGGYTRIVKLAEALRPAKSDRDPNFKPPAGVRLGDGTPLAFIELVEAEVAPRTERRRRPPPEPFRPRREEYKRPAETVEPQAGRPEEGSEALEREASPDQPTNGPSGEGA